MIITWVCKIREPEFRSNIQGKSDQQPEQEWSQIRSSDSFFKPESEFNFMNKSVFFAKTGSGVKFVRSKSGVGVQKFKL